MNTLKVYAVIATAGYIPEILLLSTDRVTAVQTAIKYAGDWDNEDLENDIYFNQEEEGNMENSITVTEAEITIK